MFKYYLYKFGQFCVTRLPLKWSYRIASLVSDMQYLLSFRDRRVIVNNLRQILPFPHQDEHKLARRVFRNFGKYLVEFFWMAKGLTKEYINQNIKIQNIHYIDEVLKEKKGGIVLAAHVGNWEMGAVVISMLGYPLVVVALPHKERPVNDLFNYQREARGVTVIQTNGAIRRCVQALKENKLVGLLADRDFSKNGIAMNFLGRPTMIPRGPAAFSLKTGAPIIPTFFVRHNSTLTLIVEKPLLPAKGMNEMEATRFLMAQYVNIIEQKIREYPTQWLMFREFWVK